MDDMEVQLRVGFLDDAPSIADYYHRCWLAAFLPVLDREVAERMEPSMWLELFRDRLATESSMSTAVAVRDGVVVGHVNVQGHDLVHLFVDPDHQGSGIGRRLLAHGEQLIADGGHSDAELHTRVGNERALGLYASAGWQLTDRLVHSAHDGVQYDEHVLIKQLAGE